MASSKDYVLSNSSGMSIILNLDRMYQKSYSITDRIPILTKSRCATILAGITMNDGWINNQIQKGTKAFH